MVNVDWNRSFPLRFGPDPAHLLTLSLMPKEDTERAAAEAFIQHRFAAVHQADIRHFMPDLLALRDHRGVLGAAVGIRVGHEEPLFVEQYLQQPAQWVISALAGHEVGRAQIVEIGNLAASSAGSARLLIIAMGWLLARRGLEWILFTGTATLVNSFRRLNLEPLLLCDADPSRLRSDPHSWGRYYAQHPRVFAGNIQFGLEQLQASGALARMGFFTPVPEACHAA